MVMLADRINAAQEARRADPVTMEEFGVLMGNTPGGTSTRTKSGVTVGTNRMLALSAWYSGVRFISEVIAGLPVHTYRQVGENMVRRADPPWLKRPDDELPWYALVSFVLMSLLHRGNAYVFKVRDHIGQVIGLREIHPDRVTFGIGPDGRKYFLIDHNERVYTTREVLHIPGLSLDGRFGMNPIRYHAEALGSVAAAEDYSQRFYAANSHIGGVITVPQLLSPQEAKDLQQEWEAFHQGLLNAHRTGVLSKGAQYNRISLSAADAQILQVRQYGVLECSRLLRLPPHKLYELSRATYSNIEQQNIESVQDGLVPWCERMEAYINYDLDLMAPDVFIQWRLSGLLRGDTQSRFLAYMSAVGAPIMTQNEARKQEGLHPVEGGDELMTPMNMAPAADGGTQMKKPNITPSAITEAKGRAPADTHLGRS